MFETVFRSNWRSRPGIPDANNTRMRDFHPTPAEHLEYCDLVFPEFVISDAVRKDILDRDARLKSGETVAWSYGTNEPKRL
jgi:hypothetical protein